MKSKPNKPGFSRILDMYDSVDSEIFFQPYFFSSHTHPKNLEGIYLTLYKGLNSQPVSSQMRANTVKPQWQIFDNWT